MVATVNGVHAQHESANLPDSVVQPKHNWGDYKINKKRKEETVKGVSKKHKHSSKCDPPADGEGTAARASSSLPSSDSEPGECSEDSSDSDPSIGGF